MTINKSTTNSKSPGMDRRSFLAGATAAAAGAGLSACTTAAPVALVAAENVEQQAREFEGRCAFVTGGARGIGLAQPRGWPR
ncbi:MAG: hypothetical protein AAF702_11710 [Chloroflexota bacterium]